MPDTFESDIVKLEDLNCVITCNICHGYLIDAVSITECLHPFCKSCIVKYLATKKTCPVCNILIHQSHPLNYISVDRTLQDIVYKVVPHLKQNETNARIAFYNSIGRAPPAHEDLISENTRTLHAEPTKLPRNNDGSSTNISHTDPNFHRNDDQVNVYLESGSESLESLNFKFLRISSKATVTHLRKYVAQNILHDISKFKEVDIFIQNNKNGTFLGRDHALKFVRVVYWNDEDPMPLQYRISVQPN